MDIPILTRVIHAKDHQGQDRVECNGQIGVETLAVSRRTRGDSSGVGLHDILLGALQSGLRE